MIPNWLLRLREIVWTSVLAVIALAAAILVAIIDPNADTLAIVLALAGVGLASLSQRV